MCPDCVDEAGRNYRTASTFFFGLAILFGVLTPILLVSDYQRFGMQSLLRGLALLIAMLVLTIGVGWGLRVAGRRLQ
jgi:hypothetical protein